MGPDLASCGNLGCLRWEGIVLLQRSTGGEEHTRKHPSCICRKQTSLVLLFLLSSLLLTGGIIQLRQWGCCAWGESEQNSSVTTALGVHGFGGTASYCILPNEITWIII